MSEERHHPPNQTYAVSRRVHQREFLLVPGPVVNAIVLYALARALDLTPQIRLHAFLAMSNHIHLVLTDVYEPSLNQKSGLSRFFALLDALIARSLNCHYGRRGHFWEQGSFRPTQIHDVPALEDQILYLLCNPVDAGLVPHPGRWPGVCLLPSAFGTTIPVAKPRTAFFGGRPSPDLERHTSGGKAHQHLLHRAAQARLKAREAAQDSLEREQGLTRAERRAARAERRRQRRQRSPRKSRATLPDELQLTLTPPPVNPSYENNPGFEPLDPDLARRHYTQLLETRVAQLQATRRRRGLGYLGAKRVQAQSPHTKPRLEPPDFEGPPKIACKDKLKRSQIKRLRSRFHERYDEAITLWPDDHDTPVFPLGTVNMLRFHQARVDGYPEPRRLKGKRAPPPAA